MLVQTSLPDNKMSLTLQVEADQAALSQDVPSQRRMRLVRTGLGFAILMLIGVSACALHPFAPHATSCFVPSRPLASPPVCIPSTPNSGLAFSPIAALGPRGTRPATANYLASRRPKMLTTMQASPDGKSAVSADGKHSIGRVWRREKLKGDNYNRAGFKDVRPQVKEIMKGYDSPMLEQMRKNGGTLKDGDVTIQLAEHYGFCWGVERAIEIAYEARAHFPEEKIFITNEIIHNPGVNERLQEMNVELIPPAEKPGAMKDFSAVKKGDVVILPAFGASLDELKLLTDRESKIVDTTCPWVSKVWNAVDRHIVKKRTTIIHGKWAHEETLATASFADKYIIVKNKEEAEYLINYMLNGGNKQEFLEKFKNAMSEGFDPDKDLENVGVANQTTMYRKETKEIGRILEKTMLQKFGPENLADHYGEFDTICDATQERQDAVSDLVTTDDDKPDFVLVVGGFESSNTAHLKEIPELKGIPAYHIDSGKRIGADNSIEHREEDGTVVKLENFLKKGPIKIGVTSGASTPDDSVEEALSNILLLHKVLETA